MKEKVLVTGGGGFLGRYILEQLNQEGYKTGSLARGSYPELTAMGTTQHVGSLANQNFVLNALEGYDAVIHTAAKAGFWGKRNLFWEPNVTGTQHILDSCQRHGIKKLVFTSSPSVVFSNKAQCGENETLPYPQSYESPYPESKARSEQMVLEANSKDLMTCALRPHLIFGPRDPHLLPKVLSRAITGKLVKIGDGENRVDLTYVEDAAHAHILALESLESGSPVCGSAYFISQDDPVNLWPWINDLLKQLDIKPVKQSLGLPMARFIGGTLEMIFRVFAIKNEPRLTRFLASELAKDHYYDIGKAKRELGYAPRFSMAEALARTLPYLQSFVKEGLQNKRK